MIAARRERLACRFPGRWLWLSCLLSAQVSAVTVYKTVDETGHVTFSDQPPAGVTATETIHLRVSDREPSALDRERLAAMVAATDRMAADRREREQRRAAARERTRKPEPVYYPVVADYGYPFYGSRVIGRKYGYHRPYRPHRPPLLKPGRPVHLPAQASLARRSHTVAERGARIVPYPAYRAPPALQLQNFGARWSAFRH